MHGQQNFKICNTNVRVSLRSPQELIKYLKFYTTHVVLYVTFICIVRAGLGQQHIATYFL